MRKLSNWSPFLFGVVQVLLVSLNTYQISKFYVTGSAVVAFGISLLWTFNVRNAMGTMTQRIMYALGASIGTIMGMYIGKLIYE